MANRTQTDIILQVQRLTEHRADKQLDWAQMFNDRLQKFCAEKRFWWRQKYFSFSSVVGTAEYDLTVSATDIEQLIRVIRQDGAGSPPTLVELNPIFDASAMQSALLDTATDDPSGWFIKPGTNWTLRLTKVPNAVKSYRIHYWAIPNTLVNEDKDSIPLVPPHLHYGLVEGLKMDVFEFLFGPESQKFILAKASYEDAVNKADEKPSFSTQRLQRWIVTGEAVRST